jgi:serine/threonine protein kinase
VVVREAGCLIACRGHPSVLKLKSVAVDENTGDMFIITEPPLVGASTLRSQLTRPFSEAKTQVVMRQLLGAAEKMHGSRVITARDINPDNILVGQDDGTLKICGFGCATTTTTMTKTKPAARHVVVCVCGVGGVLRFVSFLLSCHLGRTHMFLLGSFAMPLKGTWPTIYKHFFLS